MQSRHALCVQNDLLRISLSRQCRQLQPLRVWIEQGYNLAQHLSRDGNSRRWSDLFKAMLHTARGH